MMGLDIFLAQLESSDLGDFFGQIGGLLILTCGAGIVWVILMALVMQRAAERRRRAERGLPPLPGIHTTAFEALKRWLSADSGTQPAARVVSSAAKPASGARSAPGASMPTPDLSQLTGDLPAPDLSAMLDDTPLEDSAEPVEAESVYVPDEEPESAYVSEDEAMTAEEEPMPYDTPAPQDAPPDSVELLRVWRDLSDGSLIVEIGGRRFESLDDLRSADLERRFLNVVRDLDSLAGRTGAAPERAAPERAAPKRAAPPPAKAPAKPAPAEHDDAPPPPSMSPGSMLRQMTRVAMGQTPDPVEPVPELNIADQIEDLLQARLAKLPEYQGRKIHVRPSIEGGVRIEVDGRFFDGVGDVDDDTVRDLLMDVVREWENTQ
jgi:hypothetical protein